MIGGNGDSIFTRLMQAIGRDDMADDQKFATNADRVVYEAEIDAVFRFGVLATGLRMP